MSAVEEPHIFGIRHLSPACAYHMRRFLDKVRPTAVLIEGLSDATVQIPHLVNDGTEPPVAVIAYTEEAPVRSLLYPMAEYSPEYQALRWAKEKGAYSAFIDLPSEVSIGLEYHATDHAKEEAGEAGIGATVYDDLARLSGEADYDSYWERNFELDLSNGAYVEATGELGRGIRELDTDPPAGRAKNLVREAFMRRSIAKTIDSGHDPERIVVICGAFHASVLSTSYPPMTDQELKKLPKVKTRLTLMPYSYYRLSSRSGYGAGNAAPAYFQMMWDCMKKSDINLLPSTYLTSVARHLRDKGMFRSPAEVIEGVRLADGLAAMHVGHSPVLQDLRDAATVCLGHGSFSEISEAVAMVEVGTAIGRLPEGVVQTPLQDDFNRELKRLKLEKYRSPVSTPLKLDLRENRQVKSKDAAFLDLNRSFFLHRLHYAGIKFGQRQSSNQERATWAENWIVQWTPEIEIQVVENSLYAETIGKAAEFSFEERLEHAEGLVEIATVLKAACECGLQESIDHARVVLQHRAVDSSDFNTLAGTARQLSIVISYGDLRKIDGKALLPILQELFLRGSLLLDSAASCNNEEAASVMKAMQEMDLIVQAHGKEVNKDAWTSKLLALARSDGKNPKLSGYAAAILLEYRLLDDAELSREISRRLSPGTDADAGAGWFEGLTMRNRYVLLSVRHLWEQLADYVVGLDEAQFIRAVVFLRRTFSRFSPAEKGRIAETLGDIWGTGTEEAGEYLQRELTDNEREKLDSLKEFDFGDI